MRTIESIQTVYIEESIKNGLAARGVLERLPNHVKVQYTNSPKSILQERAQKGKSSSKDELMIYRHKGRFLSGCPGSDGMMCCQYFVLHLGQGCLFDCHYCYLQSFLNHPMMTLFGNLEDLFAEVNQKTLGKKNFHFRIGTGEYTDSLVLEPWTGISSHLISYFADHPNATLELKTKSSHVESILDKDHKGHTVISWSLNPSCIIEAIEEGTSSLEERLEAAAKVQKAGYRTSFHLDPLIYFEGWEKEYHLLIDRIFDIVDPCRTAWISMGSFRYTPALKEVIQRRFPEDELTRQGEMIQGIDGKYRYFKTVRQKMFRSIKAKIESVDPRLFLYLCMESRKTWKDVFGFIPSSAKALDSLFEERRKSLESSIEPSLELASSLSPPS